MTVLGLSDATARADESGPLSVEGARPRPVGARPDELPKATPAPVDKWFANAAIVRGGEGGHSEQKWRFAEEVAQKLVIDERSRPAAIEQYRRLAAGLHHSQKQFGTKVVMLASAVNAEGKSLSACNLALTLSQSYRKRVVLIDCDLRHPGLTELFKLPVTSGLSDALRAKSKRPLPLFQVAPGLVVVPAGRPDPDPLAGLSSERMADIIEEATSEFDWVLVDTPPVSLVPDAKLIASFVEGVLLVVRAGRSPCVLVQQTIEALGSDRIIGVLLNAAEGVSTRHQNRYYGYGYGYGYGARRP